MKRLTDRDLELAMQYIRQEPEFNLFLIGDLENYGLESEHVSAYTADSWEGGQFPYFILNYRNNFSIYSHDPDYNAKEAAAFLKQFPMRNLSGKTELVRPLISCFEGLELVPNSLARLDAIDESSLTKELSFDSNASSMIRRLTALDVPAIYELLSGIEEFYTIRQKKQEEAYADIEESITRGGRMYGIFLDGSLVSTAATTAENSLSAMLVSVASHPAYRGRGYATQLVIRLCRDCLHEGMQFLCLFYSNPKAAEIYHRLGFRDVGEYAMVRSV